MRNTPQLLQIVFWYVAVLQTLPPLYRWGVTNATFEGVNRAACGPDGACWAMIKARFASFFYGRYPVSERWRVDLVAALLVFFAVPALRISGARQAVFAALLVLVFPVIDLFKDTTLVSIVGVFDLLMVVNQSLKDQAWLGLAKEGYAFAAFVFFTCCFAMSVYSRRLERQLARGR